MAERDPVQALDRNNPGHGRGNQRKHLSQPAVKEQWLFPENEKMVEGESGRERDFGNMDRQAIGAVANLIDPGFHGGSPWGPQRPQDCPGHRSLPRSGPISIAKSHHSLASSLASQVIRPDGDPTAFRA